MQNVLVERIDGLVTLTFNRPDTKNAIDGPTWSELDAALVEVEENPEDRALVITGAGGNFSSGADLSGGASNRDAAERRPIVESMRTMGNILLRLHRLPKPTLAKVDGVAVGVGLGVALACDLVVASDRARFCEIFSKRGLALDGGNSWVLPRLVGLQKAKELAFFADMVSADEAAAIGLVNKVVPADQLDEVADEWARRLANGPTLALSLSKRLLNASSGSSFDESLEDEGRCQHILFTSTDMREAMIAYHERRDPKFCGY
jgi:2-(1,2-epoxy-1,2-dihydrophenyl)acetyl-CoA isomerase